MKKILFSLILWGVCLFNGFGIHPPSPSAGDQCWCELKLNHEGTLSSSEEYDKRDDIVYDIGFEKLGNLQLGDFVDQMGNHHIATTAEIIGTVKNPSPNCVFRFQRRIVEENWFILSNSPTEGQSLIDLGADILEFMPELTPPYMADLNVGLMDLTPSGFGKVYNYFSVSTRTDGTMQLADVGDVFIHRIVVEEWIEKKNADGSYEKASEVMKYRARITYVADENKKWRPMKKDESFGTMTLEGPPYKGKGKLVDDRSVGVTLIHFPAKTTLDDGSIILVESKDWTPYKIHNDIMVIE